ncbi:serine/threonine protein kinase [Bacillus sp. 165]|uniref:serine/threonine protein kinase n=1 Tax=Bacillus sp. 165 TaxID=1529117 RepID=UPI001ADBED64|nr:serine/threonine protein kinase [Bacillus sp. 165]MBO9129011.1 serine/threonine protein kinase [Bacillus sp. 165]
MGDCSVHQQFQTLVEKELLPIIHIYGEAEHEPVTVSHIPAPWSLIGNGNYAAVFSRQEYDGFVVKIYASNRTGIEQEIEVYKKIGSHPSYSQLFGHGKNYLILKKLDGITLFNAVYRGVYIPKQVIKDIDKALFYAKTRGLNPSDVHGKNVVLHNGRGYVVDISDFLKEGQCSKWQDLRKAYNVIYAPLFQRFTFPVPFVILEWIRKGYRIYKNSRSHK